MRRSRLTASSASGEADSPAYKKFHHSAEEGRLPTQKLPTGDEQGAEDGKRRRRKKKKQRAPLWESRKNRKGMKITRSGLIMGSCTLLAILGCLGLWFGSQPSSSLATGSSGLPQAPGIELSWKSPGKEETIEIVRGAVVLRDPVLVSDFFHLGSQSPQEVISFLGDMEQEMGRDMRMMWVGDIGLGEQPLTGVLLSPNYKSSRMRLAILTPDGSSGIWKLDFDALSCKSSPAWDTIVEDKAAEATVRSVFKPDHYYNGRYTEKQWACHRLTTPNSDHALYGYARRGSPQDLALEKILSRGFRKDETAAPPIEPSLETPVAPQPETTTRNEKEEEQESAGIELETFEPALEAGKAKGPGHRAILQLKRAPDTFGLQYEITRVLASDWVMEKTPYDQRFEGVGEIYNF